MEAMASAHPLKRVGQVSEVAKTIMFLASEGATFITGAIVPIDGGRHGTVSYPSFTMSSK